MLGYVIQGRRRRFSLEGWRRQYKALVSRHQDTPDLGAILRDIDETLEGLSPPAGAKAFGDLTPAFEFMEGILNNGVEPVMDVTPFPTELSA